MDILKSVNSVLPFVFLPLLGVFVISILGVVIHSKKNNSIPKIEKRIQNEPAAGCIISFEEEKKVKVEKLGATQSKSSNLWN